MISVSDVEHIANLARLKLNDEEKQLYATQLAEIISYFEELKELDTTGIEPMSHALAVLNVMRDDQVIEPPGHEVILKNAPDSESSFFRVPRIGE